MITVKQELQQASIDNATTIQYEFSEQSKLPSDMLVDNSEKKKTTKHSLNDYNHSLEELVNKYAKTDTSTPPKKNGAPVVFPDLESYPGSEDIYEKAKEESDLDPENPSKHKTPNEAAGSSNEKDFEDDMAGGDLDVPGSELDDQQESIGSEDEENNYYSLGGDNHYDLDEDQE